MDHQLKSTTLDRIPQDLSRKCIEIIIEGRIAIKQTTQLKVIK
jgi:hypothetical protein